MKNGKSGKPYMNDLDKNKKLPIGSVRDGREKVSEGKWVSSSRLGAIRDRFKDINASVKKWREFSAKDPENEQAKKMIALLEEKRDTFVKLHTNEVRHMTKSERIHAEESQRHVEEAFKYKELHNKLKEQIKARKDVVENYEVPEKAKEAHDNARKRAKFHKEQHRELNKKLLAMQDHEPKEQYAADKRKEGTEPKIERSVKKALIGEPDSYEAINTADYALESEISADWLEKFQNLMKDYKIGDVPRSMDLGNRYSVLMGKVDDGLYSAYVSQTRDEDGEDIRENVSRINAQPIPAIIQYLKAKEYIREEEIAQIPEEAVPEPVPFQEEPVIDKKIRLIEVLNRLLD